MILNAFGKILAVVAGAANDGTKGDAFVCEESLAGVILIADNFAKFWCIDDDITDEALVFPFGVKVKNVSALNFLRSVSLGLVAKKLINAVNNERGSVIFDDFFEFWCDLLKIFLDFRLARILATAAKNNVDIVWNFVTWFVINNFRLDATPFATFFKREDIAVIAIKVHLGRIKMKNIYSHKMLLPEISLRISSMAV